MTVKKAGKEHFLEYLTTSLSVKQWSGRDAARWDPSDGIPTFPRGRRNAQNQYMQGQHSPHSSVRADAKGFKAK